MVEEKFAFGEYVEDGQDEEFVMTAGTRAQRVYGAFSLDAATNGSTDGAVCWCQENNLLQLKISMAEYGIFEAAIYSLDLDSSGNKLAEAYIETVRL